MLFRGYLLASLPFITSVLGTAIPDPHSRTRGISLDKIKSYCPDLLNANADTLKLGLAGISIPGVRTPLQLWTSVDIVNAYNKRIDETQATLRTVIERNPDAVSFAATLDAERKAGKLRSPLHGLPILLKDVIATGDKMNNTAGSYALVGAQVDESTISKKLRAAGVIVLGKSNLSQWSNLRSKDETSGWTSRGGQTIGGYVQNQDPKGSSSGSGVGASLGLSWAAIGVETSGSIIFPSAYNNIVGIKPTVGLTSRYLTISSSPRQDTVGPMARTVSDAVALLQVIAGRDEKDNYTSNQPFASPPNYSKALKKDSLKGRRIGIPRNVIQSLGNAAVDKAAKDAFDQAIKVIKEAGAIVVDNTNFSSFDEVVQDSITPRFGIFRPNAVVGVDFYAELPKYTAQLRTNPNNITGLESLVDYTVVSGALEQWPDKNIYTWLGLLQALAGLPTVRQGSEKFSQNFTEVTKGWANEGGITGAMTRYNVEGFILPSSSSPTFPAFGGMPIITVPAGRFPDGSPTVSTFRGLIDTAPNVPIGVSFLAEKWSEEKLIGWAYAYEQKTQWRNKVSPVVKPKAQLWDVIKFRH